MTHETTPSDPQPDTRVKPQKATGPKDTSKTRFNAMTHGIFSKEILIYGEDEEELEVFQNRLIEELKPVGALEELLVDRIISSSWRLKRAIKAETVYVANTISQMQEQYKDDFDDDPECGFYGFVESLDSNTALSNLNKYETMLERQIYKALEELKKLRSQ